MELRWRTLDSKTSNINRILLIRWWVLFYDFRWFLRSFSFLRSDDVLLILEKKLHQNLLCKIDPWSSYYKSQWTNICINKLNLFRQPTDMYLYTIKYLSSVYILDHDNSIPWIQFFLLLLFDFNAYKIPQKKQEIRKLLKFFQTKMSNAQTFILKCFIPLIDILTYKSSNMMKSHRTVNQLGS